MIELYPKSANAHYNRGNLKQYHLEDTQGAIDDFRQAAQLYRQQGKTSDLKDAINRLKELGVGE
jgi:tetratricopeptide (TPR) repeat protein